MRVESVNCKYVLDMDSDRMESTVQVKEVKQSAFNIHFWFRVIYY